MEGEEVVRVVPVSLRGWGRRTAEWSRKTSSVPSARSKQDATESGYRNPRGNVLSGHHRVSKLVNRRQKF